MTNTALPPPETRAGFRIDFSRGGTCDPGMPTPAVSPDPVVAEMRALCEAHILVLRSELAEWERKLAFWRDPPGPTLDGP